jgi:hypothetical protein
MISEKTKAEYDRIIKRYENIKKLTPREKLAKMRKDNLSMSTIKTNMSAMLYDTMDEEYRKIIQELRDEVKNGKKNVNRFKKIKWIIEKIEGDSLEDVIKGLYTYFPPRRIEDYANMIYIENDVDIKKENYYIDGMFIFQKYKTQRTYGKQEFEITKRLDKLIKKYIKKNNIKSGDKLLRSNQGGFSERTLYRKLIKIFGVSVDGIRHAYITNLYKDTKNLYNIEEVSEKMAHNIGTHIKYMDKENKN